MSPDEPGCLWHECRRPSTRQDTTALASALSEWRQLLGHDRVTAGAALASRYLANTSGLSRTIVAALKPQSTDEVSAIVRIAARHHSRLYAVSTGRNWGYGCSLPVVDGCALVDLSGMDRIVGVDTTLNTVTLQPGVTQGALHRYLTEHRLDYMVPTTGAGPNGSIVGNALDRGYGLTPHADHFLALTSLEAVLPDGTIYRSPLWDDDHPQVAHSFKWGVGPYLDGLFAQGNFGIVTEATIRLARRPEAVVEFFFSFSRDEDLETAVNTIHGLQAACGGNLGGINLMSGLRMLAMTAPYPHAQVPPGQVMSREVMTGLLR
jgi:4-cresol dehydrogenase (hydroxylating)